ncbi:MAG: ATP-binding cassette domain-containing protein, partial [Pseudomonadota bacterium]|nr:ATP-binding cassette domain-containing protein [Pseudomonadota bacterium]
MTAVDCIGLALSRAGRPALAGVDWRVSPGEMQIVAGPTGAGKSALLAVAGLAARQSAGELRLFGAPVPPPVRAEAETRAALRRRIGRAEARPAFLDHLSLAENVALPLRLAGRGPADRAAQAAELLDWLGLGPRASDPPSTLSDGERRRAGLARAVI